MSAGKWPAVALLAVCQVMALGLWFAATVIVPALRVEQPLGDLQASLFSSAVALGFVAGTLLSALFGLADRLDPRRLFAAAALLAAAANALILLAEPASPTAVALRALTGVCMAGIYPVGMKIAAGWADGDTGLLVGLLVGALTLGSALPHLFNAFGGLDWRPTLLAASLCAAAAGLLINAVRLGPKHAPAPPFRPGALLLAWRDRPLRLANIGYFGHMWELYAMWAWIGLFIADSLARRWPHATAAEIAPYANLLSFATVAAGAVGSVAAGLLADRFGRTTLTVAAMTVSGGCALLVGFTYGGPPALLTLLCLVWGVSVIADSAQFSSCTIELAPPEYTGTLLTLQTCIGFTITVLTIHLLPYWVGLVGWRYAFMFLALGPIAGVIAMLRLRAHPDAVRLAGGRR